MLRIGKINVFHIHILNMDISLAIKLSIMNIALVFYFSKSLIVSQRCHPFTYGAANHCCQSLRMTQ